MDISRTELEYNRNKWIAVARNNNWYVEPFFIQVWVHNGEIVDAVSVRGLDKDYVIDATTDKQITDYKIV
jgi:hypothetical protein